MADRYDAVIIGAGIIGAAIGFELAKRGWRTLNLDKLPAAGYGPTANSCAGIRVHYSTLEGSALAYEGYFHWKDWPDHVGLDDERGHARFHEIGCMVFKTRLNGHLRKIRATMDILGVPYEDWDAASIKARFPFMDLREFAPVRRLDDPAFGTSTGRELGGAVFFPSAGYVNDPQLATHNLQRAAEANGAEFRFKQEVVDLVRESDRVAGVRLADGSVLGSPVVVNVAGPHSAHVNRLAGVTPEMKIGTRPLRQEVVHVPAPEGFDFAESCCILSDSDVGCYVRPEIGNHLLIGSEDPECDEREWVDPDSFNRDFTAQSTAQLYRVAQRIPSLPIPNQTRGCVDLYDVTDDWIPIYDKSSLGGFYMAVGTSGNQFKNAPVVGAMMAELIEYCEAGNDHDADPLQFHLKRTDRTIGVEFYSRLRDINAESSFSVLG